MSNPDLPMETYTLNPPTLSSLASTLKSALSANYTTSSISVTQCPDLTLSPFHLSAPGLSGTPLIADIGGQPNLFPSPVLSAKYNLLSIARQLSFPSGHFLGAGAGPWHILGQNSEFAPNISWSNYLPTTNNSHVTTVNTTSSVSCQNCDSPECALMMNLYGSQGLPGEVLHITARGRTGDIKSFTETIRRAIAENYDQPVSLGGVFVIKKGRAKFHVMPDFSKKDFRTAQDVNDWLTWHEFEAEEGKEIVCLNVMHSKDGGMGVRVEHTHCFGGEGMGGHYHYDLEGEEVEYDGYFNIVEKVYRIDRPEVRLERDLHDED